MSGPGDPSVDRPLSSGPNPCRGCGASLLPGARFCAHCGLSTDSVEQEPVSVLGENGAPDSPVSAATAGRAHRQGVPEWLAVTAGVAAVLAVWFVISRPSGDTAAIDRATGEATTELADGFTAEVPVDRPFGSTTLPSADQTTDQTAESTTERAVGVPVVGEADRPTGVDRPADSGVVLDDLNLEGWRLLVGDGHAIVDIDLGTGGQTRHDGLGAPISVVGDRLLVYRDSRLSWLSPQELTEPAEELVEAPALQRMFTRGRAADRPVVVVTEVDGPAVWWPNNNANPQTWVKLRLSDGEVLDSIALSETVFGGPEVVATVGSGTFERIDGRWEPVGDLFAPSASPDAIVGQRCDQPDSCSWILQFRGDVADSPQRLTAPVDGPFDLALVADADRVLLRSSDGVTDYGSGRFVPMVGANATTLAATNRVNVLAMADATGLGQRSAWVTVADLDAPAGREAVEIEVSALTPRWLVLLPPRS